MSFIHRTWRPAVAAMSVTVPLVSQRQRQPSHCKPNAVECSSVVNNTASPPKVKFLSSVAPKDANVLMTKMGADSINDGLVNLWAELVNTCRKRNRQKPMSEAEAMEFEIPTDWIRNLKANRESLAWLLPVMKWVEDPEVMQYVDSDHNNSMSFKEFSVLLLLALTQIEGEGKMAVTKREFVKSLYFLMDVDGDGTIDKEEFVLMGSLLATMGMINPTKMDNECRKRLQNRSKGGHTNVDATVDVPSPELLRVAFENAFHQYDEDGDKDLSQTEWNFFTGEWLGWNLQRGLRSVEAKDASVLATKMASAKSVNDGLVTLWAELVNTCRERKHQKHMSVAEAMEFEIPIGGMHGLKANGESLPWLLPVMKWVEDPEVMQYMDSDHNNKLSFKEFSVLLLLALTQIEGEGKKVVSKADLVKGLYFLMDIDGDGTIDKAEFVAMGSILAAMGMINAVRMDSELRKRGRKGGHAIGDVMAELPSGENLRAAFENAFHAYDEDGDKNLSISEWSFFTGEWLGWNLQRGLN